MDLSVYSEGPWAPEDRSWLGSAHGTESTVTITLDLSAFTSGTHYPNNYIPSGIVLARLDTGLYGPYAGRTNEVQTVTITGGPTGGTFTLTFEGGTTAAIAYNATAATVRSALENLAAVSPGDVLVTGSAGGPYTVTFVGGLAGTDVSAMTASGASLTGGTSPGVTIATQTSGANTGTGGTSTPVGHLFSTVMVRAGQTADIGAALLDHGKVRVSNLPANSGYDSFVVQALSGSIHYLAA